MFLVNYEYVPDSIGISVIFTKVVRSLSSGPAQLATTKTPLRKMPIPETMFPFRNRVAFSAIFSGEGGVQIW